MKANIQDYFKHLCSSFTLKKSKIIGTWVSLKSYFVLKRDIILEKLHSNVLFMLLKKRREWILSSFKNYSLFLVWGSVWLACVRIFQIWITDSWWYLDTYYKTTAFSFFCTTVMIILRYLKDKGYFQRGQENSEKWRKYTKMVAAEHRLEWNFMFSRSLFLLLTFDFIFLTFYRDNHAGESLSNFGMMTSSLVFFCYIINHFYIYYWIRKTPTPSELLLEPPAVYKRILSTQTMDKILSRKYTTRTRAERLRLFYTNNKKEVWATTVGVATVLYWTTGTDRSIADYNGETTYNARVSTLSRGWYTTVPKVRMRAEQLTAWGIDPSDFCYENSKRLNDNELNTVYERIRDEKYPKPYKLELENLKSNLEATQSNLEATQSNLEATQSNLEITKSELILQREKNLDLERRLLDLERAKESENR